jgi:hypothetical protein
MISKSCDGRPQVNLIDMTISEVPIASPKFILKYTIHLPGCKVRCLKIRSFKDHGGTAVQVLSAAPIWKVVEDKV